MATVKASIAERLEQEELEQWEGKIRTPWRDAWRQLRRHRAAMASLGFLVLLIFVAIFAGTLSPAAYDKQSLPDNYKPPLSISERPMSKDGEHPIRYLMGADSLGRDIFTRILHGARVSLAVAFVGAGVSFLIGILYGLIAGYFGGRVDNNMMRIVDIIWAYPALILIILLQVYFKAQAIQMEKTGQANPFMAALIRANDKLGGMLFIFIAIGLVSWLGMSRLMRGQVLSYKEKEFVEAARCLGAGHLRIIFRHLLPNALGPCIVAETLAIPGYIYTEAFLSFIGLGINAPRPSWGAMINDGYQALRAHPHVIFFPGLALFLTVLAFNFLGDGLRDALDPRLRD